METIIALCVLATIICVFIIITIINNKNTKLVKEKGKLYKAITLLNKKYKFNHINNKILKFRAVLKSKRSLENLDIKQYVLDELVNSQTYYFSLLDKANENVELYNSYKNNYNNLKDFTTEAEFSKLTDIKMKYKTFQRYEKKFINQWN